MLDAELVEAPRDDEVDELVDFIVARCLDQLGIEHEAARWGDG